MVSPRAPVFPCDRWPGPVSGDRRAVDPAARAFAVTIEALAEETIALIARTTQTAADRDQAYREAVQGLARLGTALPPELAGAPRRT